MSSDEMRRVADIDLRPPLPVAALILPDGQIHHLSKEPDLSCETLAEYVPYEDKFAEYPECYAVPFRCRWEPG
jgi:hypothetical protein